MLSPKEDHAVSMIDLRPEKMRAAVLMGPRQFEIREVELPEPKADEVRIKVEHCGICSSNLAPWKGASWFSYPFPLGAPGHESVGFLERLGINVRGMKVGQRVAMLGNGGFAEYQVAKANCVVPISIAGGSTFLGEPLGCAINIFRRSKVQKGDWVAIVGTGFLGTLLLQLCLDAGAKVIAVSRRQSALRMAETMGATLALSSENRADLLERVRKATAAMLCNVVIEAGGAQETLDIAGELTGIRGRLVIAGYHQDAPRVINMQEWNWRGIDVINAHERDEQVYIDGIQAAAEAVGTSKIRLTGLISHYFSLEQIEEGFRNLELRPEGFFKGVVSFC
jgi:2-desacetyl-2-hydroxyethyl bacteriochlorophyllide A dehydrogenase